MQQLYHLIYCPIHNYYNNTYTFVCGKVCVIWETNEIRHINGPLGGMIGYTLFLFHRQKPYCQARNFSFSGSIHNYVYIIIPILCMRESVLFGSSSLSRKLCEFQCQETNEIWRIKCSVLHYIIYALFD